jgi:hypothetical protein
MGLSKLRRAALAGATTSRRNKMALLAQYIADGEQVEWEWQGEPYNSRLMVRFDDGPWLACKSYDEDIRPLLKDQ